MLYSRLCGNYGANYSTHGKGVEFIRSDGCSQTWKQIKQCYLKASILIPTSCNMEFHVHMDASNIAVGTILAQNPTGKCDQPILYFSRFLNLAKLNYTMTKQKALAMVYALQMFWHYLLSNKLVFYVDHMAFTYLVNNPQPSRRVARWLLLFSELDCSIVYTLGKIHGA